MIVAYLTVSHIIFSGFGRARRQIDVLKRIGDPPAQEKAERPSPPTVAAQKVSSTLLCSN
jgi:hypothetical protein